MPANGPITIDSPAPLSDGTLFFREMAGSEQLSACFTYRILVSASAELRPKDLLGMPIGVHLETTDGGTRHFHGVIASLQYVGVDETVNYRMVLRPWFWLLTQSANCRIFQNRNVVDIIKSVFDDLDFADYDDTGLTGEYEPQEYVVQYRETDFAFVSRLMERAGIYYYFRHEASKHTLVLVDSSTSHDFPPSADGSSGLSVPLRSPDDARGALSESVDSWVSTTSVETGIYTHADYDFTNSRGLLRAARSNPGGNAHDSLEVYEYPGGFLSQDDGDARALVRLQERQATAQISEGLSNARRVTVGCLFSLTDCARADQNRDYLVTSMAYEMHGHEAETREDDEEPTFRCEFEAIPSDTQFRAPRDTDKPVVRGPQTAVVVGPANAEIWTDAYGRIKVQFHWDREGQNDENSSCWVRVSQAWAGSSFGAIHIPRIGQEVIVDFLEGDPDRPMVTGRVYNDANMPPYDLPDNQTQSGIKSRSTPGGGLPNANEIRFEDRKGQEELYLQAEKDLNSVVKNNETAFVGADRTVQIVQDDELDVGGNLDKTVGKNETVQIGVNETFIVGANEHVTVGGNQTLAVGGARSVQVAATETVTIGGAQIVAAGSQAVTTGSRVTSVAGADALTVGGARAETIVGDLALSVGGGRSESVGGDDSLAVDGMQAITISKDATLVVTKTLTLSAGEQLVIQVGDASITLSKNGDIVIKGKNVSTSANGDVTVKAASNLTLKGSKVAAN